MHLDLLDIISLYGNDLLVLTKNLKLKIIK